MKRYLIAYFFLLFIFGCNSNMTPDFRKGDRVAVNNKNIGVIVETWNGYPFTKKYSYRVVVNDSESWYNEEYLELVDPMPANLEASWRNESKNKSLQSLQSQPIN